MENRVETGFSKNSHSLRPATATASARITRIDPVAIAVTDVDQAVAQYQGLHHLGLQVDDLEGFVAPTEARGYKIPLRDAFSNRDEVVLRSRQANGVVLQILQWKGGSDVSVQDRIERSLSLQHPPQ